MDTKMVMSCAGVLQFVLSWTTKITVALPSAGYRGLFVVHHSERSYFSDLYLWSVVLDQL